VFNQSIKIKGVLLKPTLSRSGYYTFSMSILPSNYIHRLVALTFLPSVEDAVQVNHKDGDKANNTLNNLEWVSSSENQKHSRTLKDNKRIGKSSTRFTGTVSVFDVNTGKFVCDMKGNKDMESKGFDFRLVSAVLLGKRNSHKGCTFIKNHDIIIPEVYSEEPLTKTNFRIVQVCDVEGSFYST